MSSENKKGKGSGWASVVMEAIRCQRSGFLMIVLGIIGLVGSFVNINTSNTALVLFVMLAVIVLAPILVATVSKGDGSDSVENLIMLIGIACFGIALLAEVLGGGVKTLLFVPIIVCGLPIIYGAIVGVVKEHDITADVLVSAAIVACVVIAEYEAAAEIAIIMQIGGFLEEATVNHANNCITHLNSMAPTYATVVRDGKEVTVPADSLKIGDVVRIKPGMTVPADGVITTGESSVDTSILTGESLPRDVKKDDRVSCGTVNMYGTIDVTVDRVGDDSTLAKMKRLIESADANKAKIVRTADKWAVYIVCIAFSVAIASYVVTRDIYRSVTVLTVFCPCALILATPTAIMAAAGNMSQHGILIKDGGALERLAAVNTVLMDKTGTLTTGVIECTGVESVSTEFDDGRLSELVAAVESRSEHPLGKAICRRTENHPDVTDFKYVPGMGVSGTVDGLRVSAGNATFVSSECPNGFESADARAGELRKQGFNIVYIGVGDSTAGLAVLSDTIRPTSKSTISNLKSIGMSSIMLTGDSKDTALNVKNNLGMDDVVWECLPSDKLRIVSKIDEVQPSCMVGDGVNDAPSLKRATVGVAMGGMGSDMAVESSDIVFMNDDISKLPALMKLSRRTLLTIKVGITFSLVINTTAMILAVLGWMGPVAGALVHNIGSVIVIIAAAMLLRYNPWGTTRRVGSVTKAGSVRN